MKAITMFSLTSGILSILLTYHIAIVPIFKPKISGIHNAQLSIAYSPSWSRVLVSQELQQPDGGMLFIGWKF